MLQKKEIENRRPWPVKSRSRGKIDRRLAKLVKSHSISEIDQVRERAVRNLKTLEKLDLLPREERVILQRIVQAETADEIGSALKDWEKLDNPSALGSAIAEETETTTQAMAGVDDAVLVMVVVVVVVAVGIAAVGGYIFYTAMSDAADAMGGGNEGEEEEGGEEGGAGE
jgi:hypothetical protein